MSKNGVKIYGGFWGSETDFSQRDFELHETILSGNIGLPQGADNSYHVLYGEGLDSTTVLDGFVITKGNANGSEVQSMGGGLVLRPSSEVYNTVPSQPSHAAKLLFGKKMNYTARSIELNSRQIIDYNFVA